jgi:NADPH-dependent curcumin reductase CurA
MTVNKKALDKMKTVGRIVQCGMISQYNATLPSK